MKQFFLYIFFFISMITISQNLQKDLEKIVSENKLMGLTVHTFGGDQEQTFNIGMRNELQQLPITNETVFRIASISKSLASLGLLKLYDQKKFKLDDDVSKTLGFPLRNPNFPEIPITFRMILSHTSSIVDGSGYDKFLSATYKETPITPISSVLLATGSYFTADMWLNKKPGTFFTYCNLNFGLVGTLIEKLSDERFDIYIKKEILQPLKINSGFNIQDVANVENIAVLYRKENEVWTPQKDDYKGIRPAATNLNDYKIGTNGSYFGPQGGLRCSAHDLGKFLKFLKSDGKSSPKLLSKKTLTEAKKQQWIYVNDNGDNYDGFFKSYGLGLHQTNTTASDFMGDPKIFGKFIGHAGDAYGLISDAYISEKQNFGFVLITNGCFGPFVKGKTTSFYKFEEDTIALLIADFLKKKLKK